MKRTIVSLATAAAVALSVSTAPQAVAADLTITDEQAGYLADSISMSAKNSSDEEESSKTSDIMSSMPFLLIGGTFVIGGLLSLLQLQSQGQFSSHAIGSLSSMSFGLSSQAVDMSSKVAGAKG